MNAIARRNRGLFPEIFDLLESPLAGLRPQVRIKLEDYVKDGRYVLRAELPGIDTDKDVEITLARGILTIQAERHHEQKDAHRTEFAYGAFTRSITLPPGADESDVTAAYDQGILEVSVKLTEPKPAGTRILVQKPEKR
ncbi:Hsp20/alpha crystallin family protein [Nonomuraea sp. B12E4]|uniref:Hsp20/alpha crystallin family protein n=1 Tax=Nonomuraea sp. B12E4 TaxID=3153564 RepID=UPI00325DEEA7